MYGRSPTKAGLETVHQDLETLEADRQVEGNLAYHQRIVLKLAAHEVRKQNWKISPDFYWKLNFRSSNGYSNESLESLNLSSEDAESDREMDIEEEDELDDDSIDEVVIQKEVEILRGEENEPWPSIRVPLTFDENAVINT